MRQSKSGLFLPPQMVEDDRLMICRVPTKPGEICGKVFHTGEERQWQAHVAKCATENEAAIHAQSPRTQLPFMDPGYWDPELDQHMRELGRQMKKEGRLVVKPNERAGFS